MAVSRKSLIMAQVMKRQVLGIIENMSGLIMNCPHCGKEIKLDLFGSGGGKQAAVELNVPLLGEDQIDSEFGKLAILECLL